MNTSNLDYEDFEVSPKKKHYYDDTDSDIVNLEDN